MTSELLMRGPDHIKEVLHDMRTWLGRNGYESLTQLRGSLSHRVSTDPAGFERSMYMEAITNSIKDARPFFSSVTPLKGDREEKNGLDGYCCAD
jgi:hypothetical protein